MLQALRQNPTRDAVYSVVNLPSPVGGINARDALQAMPPTDALILDNMFPESTYCQTRKGNRTHSTGCGGPIQSLMTYFAPDGSEQLFAGAMQNIWDVTSLGVATSAYSTDISSNRWQYVNFTNTSGTFLISVNGNDDPLKYDGSTWSVNSLSGSISASSSLIYPFQFKERLFFCEEGSLDLWYLASEAISGALTRFPLGGVVEMGGSFIAGASFSFNAGVTIQDYFVALTSNGEAVIYTGINPNTDFVLQGVYQVGLPIGNRPIVKIGGDVIIITTQGALPLSQVINNDRSKADKVALTAKIQNLFNKEAQAHSENFGWEALVYPMSRYVIFNIPQIEAVRQIQYVMNVISGSWCRFTNLNAGCWAMANNLLYFGGNDGTVYQANYGQNDAGSNIAWDMKSAFSDCGEAGNSKFFTSTRPLFITSGEIDIAVGVNVDFDNVAPTASVTASPGDSGIWGLSKWGIGKWGGSGILIRDWLTVGRFGNWVAARCKGASNGVSVQYNGADIAFEKSKGTIY